MKRLYVIASISILLLLLPALSMNHRHEDSSTMLSARPQKNKTAHPLATPVTQSFTLTETDDALWYEFSVEPGIYEIKIDAQNKKLGSVDVDVDIFEKKTVYSVPLGKNIESWSFVDGYSRGLRSGQFYYWRTLIYIRASGTMAVSIETSGSDYSVEGEIIINKIVSFDGLETIPSTKNITMSEGSEYIVYKIDPGAYNITTILRSKGLDVKFDYVYIYIPPDDIYSLDEGEQIEIYINNTLVGTIKKDSWDIHKYDVPKVGDYEIMLKYKNTTKADGVKIGCVYIYYTFAGLSTYHSYSHCPYVWLDKAHDNYTFYSSFYTFAGLSVEFDAYDPDVGWVSYYWELWGSYDSEQEIVYLNTTTYLIIHKYPVNVEANITIYSSRLTYETINPGETKTVTLSKEYEHKYVLFKFKKDHYYKIYIDVSSNINWSVTLVYFAYVNTLWKTEEYTTRLVMSEYSLIPEDSPTYKNPEKIYMCLYTYMEFENDNLSDIDYNYIFPGTVNGILTYLYGYNYSVIEDSGDYATVTIHFEDLGEISSISPGETKDIELSYSEDGKIYEVLKLDVEIGKEYKVTIKPKSIDGEGMVEASMSENSEYAVLETYNPDAYGGYGLYESKPFRTTEDKILFEYFTNIAGTCYIWIERDDDPENFNGTISVSLEVVDPQPMSHTDNVYSASWQSTGDDRVKIFSVPIEKDRAYRINITTGNPDVAFDIIPIHESGITLLYDDLQVETYGYPYSNTYGYTFISSRFSSPRNGTVYIILVAEGNNEISITVEDVTAIPEVPITQNMYIWLPVGIAVGAVVVLLVMKILEKRRA